MHGNCHESPRCMEPGRRCPGETLAPPTAFAPQRRPPREGIALRHSSANGGLAGAGCFLIAVGQQSEPRGLRRLPVLPENSYAVRHQLNVYQRRQPRPKLRTVDRFLWAWASRIWRGWREELTLVKPATVIAWQRKRFRDYWAALSHRRGPDRPPLAKEVQELIRKLSSANIGWGVPRIVGELRKLGIEVAKSTVEKYRVKHPKSPSPAWKSFLANHLTDLVAIDFFVVPTIDFKVLYVFVALAHERPEVFYFSVTEHPTSQWVTQQIIEAFPWDTAPRLYATRSRCDLWRALSPSRAQSSHRRSDHGSAQPVAKSVRREDHRYYPARWPGLRDRSQRAPPETNPHDLVVSKNSIDADL